MKRLFLNLLFAVFCITAVVSCKKKDKDLSDIKDNQDLEKELSYYDVDSAFDHLPLADKYQGIVGITPQESLHVMEAGMYEHIPTTTGLEPFPLAGQRPGCSPAMRSCCRSWSITPISCRGISCANAKAWCWNGLRSTPRAIWIPKRWLTRLGQRPSWSQFPICPMCWGPLLM